MPQINRIRIINFSFNNNNRHIIDETFDLYLGENALLSLKNGGGKSVLVQLMLQPIIPKTRLMGRKIENFFVGIKTPSYVLIEWKLEDKGGYLLTGIAMANRDSQIRDNDEDGNNLKYFTFTSEYREANLYNIEHIPLIKRQKDKIYISDYKEARNLISSIEKDIKYKVCFFSEDDRLGYKQHLETYNISQEEWRSIVLKINESEGGVIEIFEKCKTSQQLMNDWILKTVEKVVNKEDKDQKKLEEMLENLVEELIKNEQFIYEKEIYGDFLKDSDVFYNNINELYKSIDREKDLEKEMSKMYYYLRNEINKIQEKITKENEQIFKSRDELAKIELEERSKDYYESLEKVNNLIKSRDDLKRRLDDIREKINVCDKGIKIQKASKDYDLIKEIKQQMVGITQEIEKIKNGNDNKDTIRNLEYSLKVLYRDKLEKLNITVSEITDNLKIINDSIENNNHIIEKLDKELSDYQRKNGGIETEIRNFKKYEDKIKKELGFNYIRNLLGEIENTYKNNYINILKKKKSDLENEKNRLQTDIKNLQNDNIKIEETIEKVRWNNDLNVVQSTNLDFEIKTYKSLEASLESILERYDIKFDKRFNHNENRAILRSRICELQKIERELDINIRTLNENIESLKKGTLHVSKEFSDFLQNHGFDFETGENYLRKQKKNIRTDLVDKNPILPYAFIMYDDDIKRLKQMSIDINIRQPVPIISYSDVGQKYNIEGNLIKPLETLVFMNLFDRKMIDADDLDSYQNLLNMELESIAGQLMNYQEESNKAQKDIQVLEQFNYEKNHLYKLKKDKEKIDADIAAAKTHINELQTKRDDHVNKIEEYKERINHIVTEVSDINGKEVRYIEFVEEDEKYVHNLQLNKTYNNKINEKQEEKENIKTNIEELQNKKNTISRQQVKIQQEMESIRSKFKTYENSDEGKFLDDDIENMETRLQVLKNQITSDLNRLENDRKVKVRDLTNKQDDLKTYKLDESEYINTVYDEFLLSESQDKLMDLKKEEKDVDNSFRKAENNLSKEEGRFESTKSEVNKLSPTGPLELGLIKLNFLERRYEENEKIKKSTKEIAALNKVSVDYMEISNKIEGQIHIRSFEVNTSYEIKININEDYSKLTEDVRQSKKINIDLERKAGNIYNKIKINYENKNVNIDNIFVGLEPLVKEAQNDKIKYYYLGERVLDINDKLKDLIKACEQRLENVENNKKNMIRHSYLHVQLVYDEVQKIAANSTINLEGKSRKMLRINMAPLGETEEENSIKMRRYIESCIGIIKTNMNENKNIEDIRNIISKYMSTKELLNVLSDLGKLSIDAYKIDINSRNSGYKTWEQVMKENSGGERFVSFFAVLVALMSYTRSSGKYTDDYQRNTDTKVLLMDNPFGPISSEHLLKPLFEIARKYNTQLICLTDLKQNSILNCFNLIYMIKIRQNVLGTKEYIQLEQQIKEGVLLERDEMLEKAVFRADNIEQMTLF